MAKGKILDLVRAHADEYRATEAPRILEVAPARYLTIAGKGAPDGPEFQADVTALFTVGYRVRMARRRSGHDFRLGPLETLWWTPRRHDGPTSWKVLLRVPNFVGEREVREAGERAAQRGRAAAAKARLETVDEGTCIQALHVGPYEGLGGVVEALGAALPAANQARGGPRHDIYVNVPPTPPERLRTIVRLPLATAPAARAGRSAGRDRLPGTMREVRSGRAPQHRARELR